MITISAVTGSGGANYYKSEDYYLSDKGEWGGKLAEQFGLPDEIKREDFELYLNGFDKDGQKLTKNAGAEDRRAGYDLTFSPPKTASLEMLANDDIRKAHNETVEETMKMVEEKFAQTRTYSDGVINHEKTSNMLYSKFTHYTNREAQAQLHTHVVIHNLTLDSQGNMKSISNELLYANRKDIDAYYQNALAGKLKQMGYEIEVTNRSNQSFEIKGYSREVIEDFSKRTEQIKARVEEMKQEERFKGVKEAKLYEMATLDTRRSKSDFPGMTLNDLKQNTAEFLKEKHGLDLDKIAIRTYEQAKPGKTLQEYINAAKESITNHQSAFTSTALHAEISRLSLGEYSNKEIEKAILKDNEIIKLGNKLDGKGEQTYFTTKHIQQIEKGVIDTAKNTQNSVSREYSGKDAERIIKQSEKNGFKLTDDQKKALTSLTESRDMINVVQGDAGTGKTKAVLANFAEIAKQNGYIVKGFAPTGKAAQELSQAGIKSETVDSFLIKEMQFAEKEPSLIDKVYDKAANQIQKEAAQALKMPSEKPANVVERALDNLQDKGEKKLNDLGEKAIEKIQDKIRETKGFQGVTEVTKGKEIWIVDESTMLSSKKMGELTQRAETAKAQLFFVGDSKQFKSVEQGKMFQDLKEHYKVHANLSETVRFKNEYMKQVDKNFKAIAESKTRNEAVANAKLAIEHIDKQGKFNIHTNSDEKIKAITNEAVKDLRSGKNTIVLTSTNTERQQLNESIRNELKRSGELKYGREFQTLKQKSMTSSQLNKADNFSEKDIIKVNKSIKTESGIIKAGVSGEITRIDPQKNTIDIAITDKKGAEKSYTVDLAKNGGKVSVYMHDKKEYTVNDKVIFLQNDRKTGLKNGEIGTIRALDTATGKAVVEMENGRAKDIDLNTYKHTDHAYAITSYKSQGATVDKTIVSAGNDMNTSAAYVSATRSKEDFSLHADKANFAHDKQNIDKVDVKAELSNKMAADTIKHSTLDKHKDDKLASSFDKNSKSSPDKSEQKKRTDFGKKKENEKEKPDSKNKTDFDKKDKSSPDKSGQKDHTDFEKGKDTSNDKSSSNSAANEQSNSSVGMSR